MGIRHIFVLLLTTGACSTLAMSDKAATPSPAKKTPAKKAKAPKKKAVPAPHPKFGVMVKEAIAALGERGGSSRIHIMRYVISNYKVRDEKKAASRVKLAIKKGLASGALIKANDDKNSKIKVKGAAVKKSAAKKKTAAKKPVVKKPKKAATPKKAAKKPAAKKAASAEKKPRGRPA